MNIFNLVFIRNLSIATFFLLKTAACNTNDEVFEGTWKQEASMDEYLRFNAQVFEAEDHIFLLPGKGNHRFSSVPEIMKYDGNQWSFEITYPNWASAGNSVYWQHEDIGYLVAGVNGSSAPTDEVIKLDIENAEFTNATSVPDQPINEELTGNNTNTKRYISRVNPLDNTPTIYSYDLDLGIWGSIPSPTDISTSSKMEIIGDSIFFILTGFDYKNFFLYQQEEGAWISLPDFPGDPRTGSIFKKYKNYLIYGTGTNAQDHSTIQNDLWKFDLVSHEWERIEDFPATPFSSGFSFVLQDRFYLGGGITEIIVSKDAMNSEMWSFSLD